MRPSETNPDCSWALAAIAERSELAPADADRLTGHLSQCSTCREESAWDAGFHRALEKLPSPGSPSMESKVLARVATGRRIKAAGWLAAAASVLGIGFGIWIFASKSDQPSMAASTEPSKPARPSDDYREVIKAAAERPVQPLGRIERQRDALVQALNELDKEF